ncbi:hypothetical protein [Serratia fonticola]
MRDKIEIEYQVLIKKLSLIDDLDSWPIHTRSLNSEDKRYVYEIAECQWIKRKIADGSLLLHPEISEQLIERQYKPLAIHRKMIWASVLASYDGVDSKEHFARVKKKIIKKHGNQWWLDVYKRMKPAYAARQRILKNIGSKGSALNFAASRSTFFSEILNDEYEAALRMIKKE